MHHCHMIDSHMIDSHMVDSHMVDSHMVDSHMVDSSYHVIRCLIGSLLRMCTKAT
jgi:hypothetical protein